MDLTLGNPWGLLGLLSIPAIILIHFFQRESRTVKASTLFLIREVDEDTRSGRRFHRLQQSLPMWLQILAALLITWLLCQPLWLKENSRLRVVFVLDSSLSMSAFIDESVGAVRKQAGLLEKSATSIEWTLLETNRAASSLYRGTDIGELLTVLKGWQPALGYHDVTDALRNARAVAGAGGLVIFVTDHKEDSLPSKTDVLAVGSPIDNLGFAGVRVGNSGGQAVWHALVRNYGNETIESRWWFESEGQKSESRPLRLKPDQVLAMQGAFPEGEDSVELVLEDDAFAYDNRVPLVKPQRKQLFLAIPGNDANSDMLKRIASSIPDSAITTDPLKSDIIFSSTDLPPTQFESIPRIITEDAPAGESRISSGAIVTENHPLVVGLNWNGLLVRGLGRWDRQDADDVLVWLDTHPLVFMKRRGDIWDLAFNFSLQGSNAERIPAFVLAIHRFAESIRDSKPALEVGNFETRQRLSLTGDPGVVDITVEMLGPYEQGSRSLEASYLRAPDLPGFFRVNRNGEVMLEGAAYLADSRESDFRNAESFDTLHGRESALTEANSAEDFYWPVWIILVSGLFVGSWYYSGGRR